MHTKTIFIQSLIQGDQFWNRQENMITSKCIRKNGQDIRWRVSLRKSYIKLCNVCLIKVSGLVRWGPSCEYRDSRRGMAVILNNYRVNDCSGYEQPVSCNSSERQAELVREPKSFWEDRRGIFWRTYCYKLLSHLNQIFI